MRVVSHHINSIFENNNQILTLGDVPFLLHAKRYWSEAITTMLWNYALNDFAKQLNVLKVDDYGITPMENF